MPKETSKQSSSTKRNSSETENPEVLVLSGALEKDIAEKIKAGYPIIYIHSSEDTRVLLEIKRVAAFLKRAFFNWYLMRGLFNSKANSEPMPGTETHTGVLGVYFGTNGPPPLSISVLNLYHHFLEDPVAQSMLKELIPDLKAKSKSLIILSPILKIPGELEKDIAVIDCPLPDKDLLRSALSGITDHMDQSNRPSDEVSELLLTSAAGLTTTEAENAFALSAVRPGIKGTNRLWDHDVVTEEKCSSLKKQNILEWIPTQTNLNEVGGLDALKDWVRKRKKAFTEEAREFGLPSPKGLLLVGPAGAGKSLCAKAISFELELPLIRLDMGKVFGSLVGQSESNVRQALKQAEAMSPCILWIDEIEKSMPTNSSANDSGVSSRVFANVLTWMQEKTHPVFVYATANDVSNLPPELLRKGRFDDIFSVMLPNIEERKKILEIHLNKRKRGKLVESGAIDIPLLATVTEGFSGAELEAGIVDALYSAFSLGRDLTTDDVQKAFSDTMPLSKTMAEKIEKVKIWCKGRTRSANYEPREVTITGRRIET